jgi:hypothetical protein
MEFETPDEADVLRFQQVIQEGGIMCTIRRHHGREVRARAAAGGGRGGGGCLQLIISDGLVDRPGCMASDCGFVRHANEPPQPR